MKIFKYIKNYFFYFFIFLILTFGIFVRFQDLGYSDFQGDETNAIRYLVTTGGKNPPFHEFYSFLLNQKRGPGQYFINYTNTSIFGLINEFQIRFPFFVFSILAFVSSYLLSNYLFKDKRTALLTSSFIALNGLYIAFSRITQYQAFMYFLIPLALYIYLVSFNAKNYAMVAFSGFLFSIALLTHYDTITVGSFFAGFLLYKLYTSPKDYKFIFLSSLIFLAWFAVPSVAFYSQFFKGAYYEERTSGYLTGRLFGFGLMPRTPYVELGRLLLLYMPFEAWILSFFSICFGIWFLISNVSKINLPLLGLIRPKLIKVLFTLTVCLYAFALVFSIFPIKPRLSTVLIYLSSLGIIGIIFFSKKIKPELFGLLTWFLITFTAYFFFIKDPRTHVYVTFMPGFLLAAYGVKNLVLNKIALIKYSFSALFILYAFYLVAFYYVVFINKNPEYPWFETKVFGRELYEVERARHRKIDGVFGFNNTRHWREIAELYKEGCLVGTMSSNEKDSISKFYLGFSQTPPDAPGLIYGAANLIYVQGPHSWYYMNYNQLIADPYYALLKTYKNGDYTVTYIFGNRINYPNGKMLCE